MSGTAAQQDVTALHSITISSCLFNTAPNTLFLIAQVEHV